MERFEAKDWVTWAYEPNDPNGPYAWMIPANRFKVHNWGLNGDPINDRLIRYEAPPYRVVQVFPVPEGFLTSAGHEQYVRIVMYQRAEWGGPKEKIRTFSGKLLTKVPHIEKKER